MFESTQKNEFINAQSYTDFKGLAELRLAAQKEKGAVMGEVAKQFEALFMQMLLKSMRSASQAMGKGIFDSDYMQFYQKMFDQQLALTSSTRGGLGISDMLQRQLTQTVGKAAVATNSQASGDMGERRNKIAQELILAAKQNKAVESVKAPTKEPTSFSSPLEFVRRLWPYATKAAKALGVDPKILLAQSALETGWGKSVMRGLNGLFSHNLFGIKADSRWAGEKVDVTTLEYRNGIAKKEKAYFRAYENYQDSFNDYMDFLHKNPRYGEALRVASDAKLFTQALQKAGYATDPSYAKKIQSIYNSATMKKAERIIQQEEVLSYGR